MFVFSCFFLEPPAWREVSLLEGLAGEGGCWSDQTCDTILYVLLYSGVSSALQPGLEAPYTSRLQPCCVFQCLNQGCCCLPQGPSHARQKEQHRPLPLSSVKLKFPYPSDLSLDVTSFRKPFLTAQTGMVVPTVCTHRPLFIFMTLST